jgi:hypothetical protein
MIDTNARKYLWVSAVLLGAALAQPVMADSYSINFYSKASTTIDATGSFTYVAGTFSDFTVLWDSTTFDFTAGANAAPVEGHECDGGGSISFFTYLTNADCESGGTNSPVAWFAQADAVNGSFFFSYQDSPIGVTNQPSLGVAETQYGEFSVTDTGSAPEPNSAFLIVVGIGVLALAFVVRKQTLSHDPPMTTKR